MSNAIVVKILPRYALRPVLVPVHLSDDGSKILVCLVVGRYLTRGHEHSFEFRHNYNETVI